jgi:hypothetical protein
MRIDGASAVTAASGSSADAVNYSSAPVRISTRRVDFGEHMCAGQENVLKRLLVHAGAFNLGLWMWTLFGVGTPRSLQGRVVALGAMIATL